MKHPAFDTESDAVSRKATTQKLEQKQEEQKQEEKKQKDEQLSSTSSSTSSTSSTSSNASKDNSAKKSSESSKDDSQQKDLSKTPTQPVLSSEVKDKLSATTAALKSQLSAVSSMVDFEAAAQKANETLSSLCEPIKAALDRLKELPPKLRQLVDIDGAKVSMYSQIGKISTTVKKLSTSITSAEVPITLDDYSNNPTVYPKLYAQQKIANTVTEGDCLSSGYTKTQLSVDTQKLTSMKDLFQNPEDQDVVAETCEKMFSSTVKAAWSVVQAPIQTVASIANIGPLGDMVNGIVDMIDSIVQIASTPTPKDQLDKKVAEHNIGGQVMANAADKASSMKSAAKQSASDAIAAASKAASDAEKAVKDQAQAIEESMANAFADLKMPPMLDGIDDTLRDLWDAVTMVVSNIQNIFIVAIFKLLEAVFKCFNEIVGVIGVPTLPYPLNILPTLIMDAINIMTFVLGLPMSLMNQVKAIAKRKVKAMVVADLPPPPQPVEAIQQVPPTSEDVPNPGVTWNDVADALEKKWNFSKNDASDIVKDLQAFFDGSDSQNDTYDENGAIVGESFTRVFVDWSYEDSAREAFEDRHAVIINIKRIEKLPLTALEEWLPTNIETNVSNSLKVPAKRASNEEGWIWKLDENDKWDKEYIPCSCSWELKEYTTDQ